CSDLLLIVDEMRLSKSTPGPSAGSTGSSSLLLELADLRDRGIISSEEFEKKKQEILDRM
ncbi:MAG: SHOCT domain-containing protein, partial [Acidobacteria bacterium]|nr:SHOCT domain-containing protein [Acidobacteriota bacterium]